jgi:hypothetical protein
MASLVPCLCNCSRPKPETACLAKEAECYYLLVVISTSLSGNISQYVSRGAIPEECLKVPNSRVQLVAPQKARRLNTCISLSR